VEPPGRPKAPGAYHSRAQAGDQKRNRCWFSGTLRLPNLLEYIRAERPYSRAQLSQVRQEDSTAWGRVTRHSAISDLYLVGGTRWNPDLFTRPTRASGFRVPVDDVPDLARSLLSVSPWKRPSCVDVQDGLRRAHLVLHAAGTPDGGQKASVLGATGRGTDVDPCCSWLVLLVKRTDAARPVALEFSNCRST
jgi:hypothetical protein